MLLQTQRLDGIWHRLIVICFREISRSTRNSNRLNLVVALIMVEIQTAATRSHNHVVLLQSSRNTSGCTTPRHHGSLRAQTTFEDFIPADDLSAVLSQHLLHALDHVALESFLSRVLAVSLQAFSLDALLAGRTVLPAGLRALVTTDVEIFAREERHYLANDILQEVEHIFLTRTHHDILNTPNHSRSPLLALAGERWISSDCCHHVTRKVDFRNHGDVALGCIIHDVLDFLLCIETAIGRTVTLEAIAADGSQLRIFLDFDTPALVLSEVEVHGVYLEHRHDVELLLHIFYGDEVTAWIEMEATVAEARRILDVTALSHPLHAAHLGSALHLCRQQLHEALHTIEGTLSGLRLDYYALAGNSKAIAFLSHLHGMRNLDRDISLLSAYGYIIASRCLQLISHILCDVLAIRSLIRDHYLLRQYKLTLLHLCFHRHRDNINICSYSLS